MLLCLILLDQDTDGWRDERGHLLTCRGQLRCGGLQVIVMHTTNAVCVIAVEHAYTSVLCCVFRDMMVPVEQVIVCMQATAGAKPVTSK